MSAAIGNSVTRKLLTLTASPVLVATAALVVGLVFYVLLRPEGSAPLLRMLPAIPNAPVSAELIASLGWLPSFLHVFAMSLLTWIVLGRSLIVLSAGTWCAVNLLFELGQREPQILTPLQVNYAGTFDPYDVVACIAGGLAACVFARVWRRFNLETDHETT